jgi:4-hydroxythreonine-4-phosphate dehydrogenase
MDKAQDKDLRPVVGITHGDINGISYEVIMKTFSDPRMLEICTPVVYGSSKIASYHRKALNISELNFNLVKKAEQAPARRLNIVNCTDKEVKIELGESSEVAGQLAYTALEMAVADLKSKHIDVLVTAPINKKNIQSTHFNFKGHTEYLSERFSTQDSMMMMLGKGLRMGFITGHLPIHEVPAAITQDLIVRKLTAMNQALLKDFGIRKPTIALLGLNPHAGDDGVIGSEEKDVIIPAMKKAQAAGILCFGPFPPDGFFGSLKYREFDAVMAMYHDQGMTAFKLLCFDDGVNFTAGLPIVRTSPAHGTAYDLAGKNLANHESFRQAVYMACDIFANRQMYENLTENPLKYRTAPQQDEETDE